LLVLITLSYRRERLTIDILFVVSVGPVALNGARSGAISAARHTPAAGPDSDRGAMIPADLTLVCPPIPVKDPTYPTGRDPPRSNPPLSSGPGADPASAAMTAHGATRQFPRGDRSAAQQGL
jgi:hypothetical protein